MKKFLCLSLASIMSLSMATSVFAYRVGNGNVNGDDVVGPADSAWILQYVLDNSFDGSHVDGVHTPFILKEANYNGDYYGSRDYWEPGDPNSPYWGDLYGAQDCILIVQDNLDKQNFLYADITIGKGDTAVTLTERIRGAVNENGEEGVEGSLKVVDFVDDIILSGDYDAELANCVDKFNVFMDNVQFTGNTRTTSIRTEIGWAKFADAVFECITDQTAFDALNIGEKRFTTVDELKEYYTNAKQAFGPTSTAEDIEAVKAKFTKITGAEYVTVTAGDDVYTLDQVFDIVADNNLQDYDELTINDLRDIFGDYVLVEATSTTGVTNTMSIQFARR